MNGREVRKVKMIGNHEYWIERFIDTCPRLKATGA